MIGIYAGTFIFLIGLFLTLVINRNVEVSMSNDFFDMPIRIKLGIILLICGVFLICVSVLFMLITNPVESLRN